MKTTILRPALALALALAAAAAAFPPPAAAQAPEDGSAWGVLEQVRRRLAAAGPTATRFEQTYVPAGFSSGERETGRLALSLPDCLRWDYDEPYPKSFLVCGDVAHSWNEADGAGQRREIDSRNEPGLDLLLLSVEALQERYRAGVEEGPEGRRIVRLEPLREVQDIREAALTVDPGSGRVTALEYADREGNRTRFTLSDYGPLAATDLFTPPAEITWQDG